MNLPHTPKKSIKLPPPIHKNKKKPPCQKYDAFYRSPLAKRSTLFGYTLPSRCTCQRTRCGRYITLAEFIYATQHVLFPESPLPQCKQKPFIQRILLTELDGIKK